MSRVSVKDLSLSYDNTDVLKTLSLDVAEGEFVVLLGPSGCGKSTLLNCIAGLIDVSAGQVFINDKNVTWDEPKDRQIGMVFQSYALYPQMTVEKNLSFSLRVAGVPKRDIRERVYKVAKTLQIESLLGRKPAALSGGQRQRVAIGRALVRDVNVFLFDEPLSNLDAKLRTDLRIELKRLHQTLGNTMIYVTHDQVEAMTLADRIAVMTDGKIQQFDTPHEVYNNPRNKFVADFIGSPSMNFFKGVLRSEAGRWELATPTITIPLDDYLFVQTPEAGQTVEIGIRPEHIVVGESALQQPVRFEVHTEIVELTGSEKVLRTLFSNTTLAIVVNSESTIKPGDTLNVGCHISNMALFDSSGNRL